MKTTWFKKFGWFYFPSSILGWIICGLALAFCVNVFIAIDRNSHSVSDTLYGVFSFWGCTFLLVNWVGSNTSQQEK